MKKLFLTLLFALLSSSVFAINPQDSLDMKNTVESHIVALQEQNWETAYALLDQNIKDQEGGVMGFRTFITDNFDIFLQIVSYEILEPYVADQGYLIVPTKLSTTEGEVVIAAFFLQYDKGWKIASCVLIPTISKSL